MDRIKNLLRTIVDATFPRYCVRCGKERSLLCGRCTVDWTPTRPEVQYFDRESSPVALISSFYYADPVARALIGAWKYHFDQTAWRHLSHVISLNDDVLRSAIQSGEVEAIIPVPLHRNRLNERGFDQAEIIAKSLSERFDVPKMNALKRVRSTGQQAEREELDRIKEMELSPFESRGTIPENVLLVDDVWTTGATALAAVRTLKSAGAKRVWIYTVARG